MSYKANEQRYDKMEYRRCGNSGLLLPAISLGLWHNFGHSSDFKNAQKMIFAAFDLGITHFDLANNYGTPDGSAELNFGKIMQSDLRSYRDELIISSKAGYRMWPGPYGEWGSRKYLLASLDQSLSRMQLDYVDIFYSHRPDPDSPLEETMGALAQAVRQGKTLYAGISSYNAEQTRKAAEILESLNTPCLIHQPNYSMLERWVEDKLLDTLEAKGIGSIAFCPLAQGLLTEKYLNGIPKDSRISSSSSFLNKNSLTDSLLEKIKKLREIAKNRNQTLAQMALVWLLKDKRITSVLTGASRPSQIKENVNSLNNAEFSDDELKQIEGVINNQNGTF